MRKEFLYIPIFILLIFLADFLFVKITGSRSNYFYLELAALFGAGFFVGIDRKTGKSKTDKVRLFAVVIPLGILLFLVPLPYILNGLGFKISLDYPAFIDRIIYAPLFMKTGLVLMGYFTATAKR